MSDVMFGLLAETFLHPGSGQSDGAIDLKVAREAVTGYPYIPGSAVKGALRAAMCDGGEQKTRVDAAFGQVDGAGSVLVSDARLLLLPVRSLTRAYLWLTCPLILERLRRDLERAGLQAGDVPTLKVDHGKALTDIAGRIFLEDRLFEADISKLPPAIPEVIGRLIADDGARGRLSDQLCIIADDDFRWFAENALPVQARNVLDTATKASNNLWYEESLPPDTLLYMTLTARGSADGDGRTVVADFIEGQKFLQFGGNETVGQGWVRAGRYPQPAPEGGR
ncbi:MAG: type III-B CRISPR module RAMP protein Cmr4 [Tistrella sp.]|nr:type III-B CRISPR module RAMP protein Cmr4 [Tistrella sp.]MAD38633.1 type III-B CRISPR module RAMP protein Cmr4 [Tistrella sp.]MBA77432.1 type III-B CRISPR module RAMP protein Cmr4 [Tistrella sp.]